MKMIKGLIKLVSAIAVNSKEYMAIKACGLNSSKISGSCRSITVPHNPNVLP